MSIPDSNYTIVPAAAQPSYPWFKHTLAVVLAVGLGFVAASGIQYWSNPQPQPNPELLANLLASQAENAVIPPVASLSAPPRIQPRLPVLAPRLTADVIVGSSRFDNPEQLALPSDSVFALNLQADHGGRVDVYAINPEGHSAHIWSGQLQSGQDLRTPAMRLQGARGLETLRLVFKADATDGRLTATVVRQLAILHV